MSKNFEMRLILILTSLPAGVMAFFLPIYSKSLNMNALEISGLFSIMSLALIILRPLIGKLIDKVGRKPILITGVITYTISYLLFLISTTSQVLYLARCVQGIASAFMMISIYAIVADTYNLDNISKRFEKINSAKASGNIYGCLIAFFILSIFDFLTGWKILFITFTMATLIALYKVITTFNEKRNTKINKKLKLRNYSKTTIKLLIIIFISSLSTSMISPILMIFLQDNITTDMIGLSLAFFPATIISSSYSYKLGEMCEKLGKNKSMKIGMIISGISCILIPNLKGLYIFTIIWTMLSMSKVLYDLAESRLYTQLNDDNDSGEIFGIYTLMCDIGVMIGPLIGGFLYEYVSSYSPFYLNGLVTIILGLLIPIVLKESVSSKK